MKKAERIALTGKLLTAITKVLQDNKAELTNKTKKMVKKSSKKIAKKIGIKRKKVSQEKK
jgi:ABC-type enterochelin transport system ATPase subunit